MEENILNNLYNYPNINKHLLIKLKIKYRSKTKLYKFIDSIFTLGCLQIDFNKPSKYYNDALKLKKIIYPNTISAIAGYYCPFLYWIVLFLLKEDNNIISCYFKGRAFQNLPGDPKQYDLENYNILKTECINNSIQYYKKFLKEFDLTMNTDIVNKNIAIRDLADNYLALGEYNEALYYYKIDYKNQKSSHSAKKIAFIENPKDMSKQLNTLLYYYEDMRQNSARPGELKYLTKTINYLKEWCVLKEKVYTLMKQNKKQVEIMEILGIDKNKIRVVINYLKDDNKVQKVNNKYVAI